jgi:hypothetical protein
MLFNMEQYIHTLIPVDAEFAPESTQVAGFLSQLASQFEFSPIPAPGAASQLIVAKPSGRVRWGTNPMTGEKASIPDHDRWNLERFEDIAALIQGSHHYTVSQSGQWLGKDMPVVLLQTNGAPFEGKYLCAVSCESRPQPVSTSAWDVEAGPNTRNVPTFGSECEGTMKSGIFPNPWTGAAIEVADAGCARFWIEFAFGRFIYPKITNGLEVLNPALVLEAEQCFNTKFAQGCRFW